MIYIFHARVTNRTPPARIYIIIIMRIRDTYYNNRNNNNNNNNSASRTAIQYNIDYTLEKYRVRVDIV